MQQPLTKQFSIVNKEGNPTDYFLRWLQQNQPQDKVGATKFVELTDVPDSYSGKGDFLVSVNFEETALEFTDKSTLGGDPIAVGSNIAVNGTADTFMRSDASPAIQLGSDSQFGLVKVDGTTITAIDGVITSVGGSGGNGFNLPYGPPSASTWPIAIGAPASIADVTGVGAVITTTNAAGGVNLCGYAQTLPSPGSPYTITARFRSALSAVNFSNCGFILANGSGKLVTFGPANNGTMKFDWWSSPTTFNNEPMAVNYQTNDILIRLKDDGTNLIASASQDGVNFTALHVETRGAYLTGGATQAGFFFNPQYIPPDHVNPTIACLYWNITNP